MATKTKATTKRNNVKKTTQANPTLHGLLIARTFSGTVVRVLTFAVLVLAVSMAGISESDGLSSGSAFSVWAVLTCAYLLFDVLYVAMTKVRPLHPRLDRAVLPLALVFSLVAVYAPLVIINGTIDAIDLWLTAGVLLVCVLGVRLALLMASTNRR